MFSDIMKHFLLKSIHIHNLNLLNFVCVVVLDVKGALEKATLAVVE